jgi:23S rRNA (cytosine1962-C5)-methyltransferase
MRRALENALHRRAGLDLGATNALRLVDGEGDDLPGLFLDEFAGRRLLSTTTAHLPADLRVWLEGTEVATYWKKLDRHDKEAPAHLAGRPRDEPFTILENNVRFTISFQAGYSQGLFLDQRENRLRVRERCESGDTVLNTFAYTGAFSVCAALGGAITTTLDLSQPYLDWAKDNFRLNRLDPGAHHFCKGDTFHWLSRFAKQGRAFTGIILDPPTFSRDDKGQVFRAEDDYGHLLELAAACLAPHGWILCTTNCSRLSHAAFERMIRNSLPRASRLNSYPMPPDFTGAPYLKSLLAIT